ncbi:hypothetical protein HYDPIDRAFT_106732 [Hydnomerulius pinastri MD-312]|nr:hypothetical protein HYDPIDRAFT_106732 [Hydnomerulius pinastri MD-312]
MLHHAHRLFTSVTLPLSSILQAAAARAWARRAYTNSTHKKKCRATPNLIHDTAASSPYFHWALHGPGTNVPLHCTVGVHPIDADTLSEHDIEWNDPGRTDIIHQSDPPWNVANLIASPPAETLPFPQIPNPTTAESLYQNLLHIISNQPFVLSTVIRYHFDFPRRLWSTRSFNLLIGLALRQTAFGIAGRLFSAMRREVVPANMETWKLTVRWLVRTGRWGEAWRRVLTITEQKDFKVEMAINPTKPIPLPLWLELFALPKRGALRRWTRTQATDNSRASHWKLVPIPSRSSPALQESRYRALMQVFPPLLPSDHTYLLPRTVLIIVRAMIQVGRRDLALSMASSYLKTLPPHLRRCDRRTILEIVHFYLHVGVQSHKPGLERHYAQRRTLYDLLDAHRGLRPSPRTLYLLLGSLRACRRSGSLAMRCFRLFQKRWGNTIQSSMVRRRIMSLALKEGRLDIAECNLRAEKLFRRNKVGWRLQREVLGGALPQTFPTLMRRPWRTSFGGWGVENRRWHLLKKKLERRKQGGSINQ